MRYPGGKGQAGIYQRIINLIPPHDLYVELFVGGGNVLERKRPAAESIAVDADARVCRHWRRVAASGAVPNLTVIRGDAAGFLKTARLFGATRDARRFLIYLDPPYLATRSPQRYRHKFTERQHADLLGVLVELPALVMLSGYRCRLYDDALAGWHRVDFPSWTRGHTWATESLWFNFDPPAALHDYRYIGGDFRERERIKRMQRRWCARLERLPASVRLAMLERLLELASPVMASGAIAGSGAAGSRGPDHPLAVYGDGDRIAGPGGAISSPGLPMVDVRLGARARAVLANPGRVGSGG
jgi:hypothetical protein